VPVPAGTTLVTAMPHASASVMVVVPVPLLMKLVRLITGGLLSFSARLPRLGLATVSTGRAGSGSHRDLARVFQGAKGRTDAHGAGQRQVDLAAGRHR